MLRRMKAFETRPYFLRVPPFFNGKDFAYPGNVVIPSHDEYNLQDLSSAGLLSPVSTAILHDDSAVINNIANLNHDESPIVEDVKS